ncbi:MAG: elongation factor P [Elusimicrobiota bacterium]|jgi:elongation factor P
MLEPVDFRNGLIIEYEGTPYQILWFQNHKTAMSHAIMRVKFKNLYTGSILERTFKQADRFKEIIPTKRKKQFLYVDGDMYHFMDMETFEQLSYPKEKLGDMAQYLTENLEVEALYLDDKFLSIALPTSVEMKVSSTVPGIKGDSVSNMMKPATLETGVEIQVPLFVKEGDSIRVDTRTGEYLSRA